MYVHHVHVVPIEASRWHLSPWNWVLWVGVQHRGSAERRRKPGCSLAKAPRVLSAGRLSSPDLVSSFWFAFFCSVLF